MKKYKRITLLTLLLSICFTCFVLTACKSDDETPVVTGEPTKIEFEAAAVQVEDKQLIRVSWESEDEIKEVSITLKHGEDVEKTMTVGGVSGLGLKETLREESSNSVVLDAFYGRHTIEVVAKNGDNVSEIKSLTIDVYTDEYNIAPLVATVPVSVFTLGMRNYTNNYTIPTFFWLERANAWDFKYIPNNVYPIPTATQEEFTTEYSQARDEKTIAWIKELYEINNDSKFNFFCNDYWSEVWLKASYGNGIPVENFKVTLLSDGIGSYSMFNDVYNNANAQQNYEQYVDLWEDYKAGTITDLTEEQCRALVYVWVQDEDIDVTWVINRIDTIGKENAEVSNKITELYADNTGRIRRYYLDKLWNELTETEKAHIKKLYHIGDVFSVADEQGKTPMIILGTAPTGEGNILEQNIKALMSYYGNDYVYYYKGHPMYPTNAYPEKHQLFQNLGVLELESSIPAEFFYYFYPSVAYSGYGSSTFTNVGDEPSKAVFSSYENCNDNYKGELDVFISQLDSSNATYGSLVSAGDNTKLLVQNKADLSQGVFAKVKVFDSVNKTFKMYNLVDGVYVEA